MEHYSDQPSQIFTETRIVYAGFWRRFVALLIDGIVLQIVGYFIGMLVGYSMFDQAGRGYVSNPFEVMFAPAYMRYSLTAMVINWLYFAWQESSAAQATLGKRAMGVRVVGDKGQRISFLNATGRYFGKIVSTLILFIGFLMVAWDSRKQALHDKMANTFVVKG
jgi:uncharacterized RDD family membrane protein YckC